MEALAAKTMDGVNFVGWAKSPTTKIWHSTFTNNGPNKGMTRPSSTSRLRRIKIHHTHHGGGKVPLDLVNHPEVLERNPCSRGSCSPLKRQLMEKVFWIFLWIFGVSATIYLLSALYIAWSSRPTITVLSDPNYPVTNIHFPAVTICAVNKAVNEKMVIQACNHNMTFTKMRRIIRRLVDPEARNHDDIQTYNNASMIVDPATAMKYLRLVAPKCKDFLLSCRWDSAAARCSSLFKLTLTDTGYCCTFNSVEPRAKKFEMKTEAETQEQEANFAYLQKAVWEYTDRFREKNGPYRENLEASRYPRSAAFASNPAFSCDRIYDDDLFPGICTYLKKCTDNPRKCKLRAQLPSSSPLRGIITDKFPLKSLGAGRGRGLTLMLDTNQCDNVPTESFKGLRVLIHNPIAFPAVGERGFIVGPGLETQVAVTSLDIFTPQSLRAYSSEHRGCYFSEEFILKYYDGYSQSTCFLECENAFISEKCNCVPYYAPGNYSSSSICTPDKFQTCVRKAMTNIAVQKFEQTDEEKTVSSICTDLCLPACEETLYKVMVTSSTFPSQAEPNMTQMLREAMNENREYLDDISYVSGSISVLRVFFQESSVLRYTREPSVTWQEFISNLGGVMGFCFVLCLFLAFLFRLSVALLFPGPPPPPPAEALPPPPPVVTGTEVK